MITKFKQKINVFFEKNKNVKLINGSETKLSYSY